MNKKKNNIEITTYNPNKTIADAPCLVGYDPQDEYCAICNNSVAWATQEEEKAYQYVIKNEKGIYICTLFYCQNHKKSEIEKDAQKQYKDILNRTQKEALFTIEGKVERLHRVSRNRDILQEHFLNETLEEIHKENTDTTKKATLISVFFGLLFFIASIVVALLIKE